MTVEIARRGVELRALVVEDEWVAREFLVRMIESSGLSRVIGAVGDLDAAVGILEGNHGEAGVDVVFVDVHLVGSKGNGLDLVRAFGRRSAVPWFVLATAFRGHAIEAFELGAADYLLKPFSQRRVIQCLERLVARAPVEPERPPTMLSPIRIVARSKRNLVFLDLDDVWAFESADRLTVVHCQRGTFDVDLSLVSVEQSFARRFLRVHRSWIVNQRHIQEWERDGGDNALLVGAVDGDRVRVPVARERAASLRVQLVDESLGIRRR